MANTASAEMLCLVTRLQTIHPLTPDEVAAIMRIPYQVKVLRPGGIIAAFGSRPTQCCVVIHGVLARLKMFGLGQRQIMALHLPGDVPDILGLHLSIMDHDLTSLAQSRVALIQHDAIRSLIDAFPGLGAALWKESMIEAAISREWMARNRQIASKRMAHLLCELFSRLDAIGLTEGNSMRLPLTQQFYSEALSLSAVHVNRVIQELRQEGLVTWQRNEIKILNWGKLKATSEFDPIYLHSSRPIKLSTPNVAELTTFRATD